MVRLTATRWKIDGGRLVLELSATERDIILAQLGKAEYLTVELKKPGRARTTGERSQNHAINGYCAQIANATGQDFDTVKSAMKRMACSRGYPFDTEAMTGEILPASESDLDTREAAILIETIVQFAAEYGIRLMTNEVAA